MAKHTINVSVLAETKQFRREMRNLGDLTGIKRLSSGIASMASKLKDAAKWAGVAVTAIGGLATKAASDLEQSMGTVDDIFKGYASAVHANAKAAAKDVGLSRSSYNELASILSTQLKNGGTALDQLGGKAHDLIKLGSDLSAGFGGSTADAVSAISSALKGERDPIEKYGVSLKQASIDAKAAALGFKKVGGSLSDEAQQAATLALIMDQTTDMHGKFARESDTLAHKQEVLKAQLTNLGAQIGSYLIPAISSLVGWVSDHLGPAAEKLTAWIERSAIPALKNLADRFKSDVLPYIKQFAGVVADTVLPKAQVLGQWITSTLVPGLKSAATWIKDNKDLLIILSGALVAAVAAFRAYQIAMTAVKATQAGLTIAASALSTYQTALKTAKATQTGFTAAQTALNAVIKVNPIGLIVTALAAFATGLYLAYQHNETFRNAVNAAWEGIKTAVETVVQWFSVYVMPTLSAVFTAIVAALTTLKDAFTLAWNIASTVVSTAVNIISAVLTPVIAIITGIFDTVAALVSGVWSVGWTLFSSVVSGAWAAVSGIISGVANFLSGIFSTVSALINGNWSGAWLIFTTTLSGAWSGAKRAVSDGIGRVVSLVSELPGKVVSAIGNVGSTLWNAGSEIIGGFIRGITSGFTKVKNTLAKLTSWLPDWKGPKPLDRVLLRENGRLVIEGFITGLEKQFPAVRASLASLTGALPGMIGADAGSLQIGLATGYTAPAPAPAPVINVYTLNPTAEAGRVIARALEDHYRNTGRRLA